MGFKYWWGGLILISGFVDHHRGALCGGRRFGVPKMVNDLGNHPSKVAKIQVSVWWIYLVEVFFLICLVGYGSVLYNWNFD